MPIALGVAVHSRLTLVDIVNGNAGLAIVAGWIGLTIGCAGATATRLFKQADCAGTNIRLI